MIQFAWCRPGDDSYPNLVVPHLYSKAAPAIPEAANRMYSMSRFLDFWGDRTLGIGMTTKVSYRLYGSTR